MPVPGERKRRRPAERTGRASVWKPVPALLVAVLGLGWLSCSGKQSAANKPGAAPGNDGGGAAGAGGAGGAGAKGGSGGPGGSGGSAGGHAWNAAPEWKPTSTVVAGCTIERLVNAPDVRFFTWAPCSWSPADCEQAVLNPDLVGPDPDLVGSGSTVQDDGTTVRVGLEFDSPGDEALFATQDGMGLAGIRPALSSGCHTGGVSLRTSRFGVQIWRDTSQDSGGVLGDLDGGAEPVGFTLGNPPPGSPQGLALGPTRWLWWWSGYGYGSVSASDGSGYAELATLHSPEDFAYLGPPVATGKLFLFDALLGGDAGLEQGAIFYSDGVAAPQAYLQPTAPDTYYGRPIYAGGYVAFFKGIGFQAVDRYDSVELWASPYSDDPAQLQPVKVADMPFTSMPARPIGGWGLAAFAGASPKKPLWVWNLAKGAQRTYQLPADHTPQAILGVTRTHLWLGASKPGGATSYLLRLELP